MRIGNPKVIPSGKEVKPLNGDPKLYLPKYTLNQLANRVCSRLSDFPRDAETLWEGIPELCFKIEEEPRCVDSVIVETKKKCNTQIALNLYKYQHVLTQVYMLLYYRHRDDVIYQSVVFPEMVRHMGKYGGDSLKNIIQPMISEILKLDKQVEKSREEEKKNVQPMFEFVGHSPGECDQLYEEYCRESLFRFMQSYIENASDAYQIFLDTALIWYNAKRVVHTLRDAHYPEMMIQRAVKGIAEKITYNGFESAQFIMLCAYVMVYSMKGNNAHFTQFIKNMESMDYGINNLFVIMKYAEPLKRGMDEFSPFDGTDYINEAPPSTEVFTRADIERISNSWQKQLAEKDEQISKLVKEIDELKNQSKESLQDVGIDAAEVENLKEQLQAYKEKAKGITTRQMAILGYKIAERLKMIPSNKKNLAIPLHLISGYGKRNIEKNLCSIFTDEEEIELANIFREFPAMAKIIYKKWQDTPLP